MHLHVAKFVNLYLISETKPIVRDMMRVPLERVWEEIVRHGGMNFVFIAKTNICCPQVSGTVSEPSYASHNLEAMQKNGVISDQDWWSVEMTCSQLFVGKYHRNHGLKNCIDPAFLLQLA